MAIPTDLEHDTGKNQLTITWADGTQSAYPLPYLRGWCPCAGCQGHGAVTRFIDAPDDLRATEIREVGAYALRFQFSDGHDDGIYTWDWLRRLSPEAPPRGFKRGAFDSGVYLPS